MFGLLLKVYLDIFLAVKQFTEKVPKCHALSYACVNEWWMMFRARSDRGKEHLCLTPAPDVLEQNLDEFIEQWKEAEYDGRNC